MLDRVKRTLVESYVGAVGLGYLLAQVVIHFVNIFAAPLAAWASHKELSAFSLSLTPVTDFPVEAALPELVRFVALLVVWFLLLRWLYFKPVDKKTSEKAPSPKLSA